MRHYSCNAKIFDALRGSDHGRYLCETLCFSVPSVFLRNMLKKMIIFNSELLSTGISAVKGFLLILFSFSQLISAQETRFSEVIISIAEELAEEDSDPQAIEMYFSKLSDLNGEPVDLNSADETELSRLFFLTDFQVKTLADYLRSSGRIFSVYEIANIPGFNRETAEMIIPFINLRQSNVPDKRQSHLNQTLLTNIIYSTSARDTAYDGSPIKLLSRYKFSAGGFSGGFTMEKDPGEKILSGQPPLPDFFSANMSYSGRGIIRKMIIGDFSAMFGEGTCITSGWNYGLFLTSPGYMRSANEIRPYSSAEENKFFRGAAASFALKDLSLTIFYSNNRIDATPGDSGDHVINLYSSGIHNTTSSILKKDILTDISYGINLSYEFKNTRAGMVMTEDRLSLPFAVKDGDPENIFDFSGSRNSLYSFYYKSLFNRMLLFGEAAFNSDFNHAFVQGVSMRMSDRLSVNFLLKNFENGYFSFHGKGSGTSENSILGNFTFEAAKHLFISGGCDIRSYRWLKFRCSAPSDAIRQEVRIKYLPEENLSVEAVFNYRRSMNDNSESKGIPYQDEITSKYARGVFRYSPSEQLTFSTRLDYKSVNPGSEAGMLLLQDLNFVFKKIPLTVWFRYCVFRTDGWNSRLYAYENDLLYNFNIPALSGAGSRTCLMGKYKPGDFAEIRFKYGITGKRIEAANVEYKEDFRLQVRLFF
jgi:hypothetical protein